MAMDIKECERVVVRKERPLNYHRFVISCSYHVVQLDFRANGNA